MREQRQARDARPSDVTRAPAVTPSVAALALQRAIGNRATTRLLSRVPANAPVGQWTLLYKDKFGSYEDDEGDLRWRKIELDDPEFNSDYIDYNIRDATVEVDLDTGEWSEMKVHYRGGRIKLFKRGELPTTFYTKRRAGKPILNFVHLDSFERYDEDGFIYPTYQGRQMLLPTLAPNLTSLRDQAEEKAEELVALRKLAFLTGTFLGILGMNSGVGGGGGSHRSGGGFRGGPRGRRTTTRNSVHLANPTEREISVQGATPRAEPKSKPTGPGGQPEGPPPSMKLPDKPTRRPPASNKPTSQSGGRSKTLDEYENAGGKGQRRDKARQPARPFNYKPPRGDRRYREGSRLGLSTAEVDTLRAEIVRRPRIGDPPPKRQQARPDQLDLSQLAADHRGANSHFDMDDPARVRIVLETINDPQAILVSRNGSWIFYRNGTVVVTGQGTPNVMRTAYGRGGRIPPRRIGQARAEWNSREEARIREEARLKNQNVRPGDPAKPSRPQRATEPEPRVGDPEAPVQLEDLLGPQGNRDFEAFKIWP